MASQELWIGKEKYAAFQGKKLCFLDDVVSTGGTIEAVLALAKEIGIEISVIACALTEGEERACYKGIPLVCLGSYPASREDLLAVCWKACVIRRPFFVPRRDRCGAAESMVQ